MGSWSYVSLTGIKDRLGDSAATDDAVYRSRLEAASEAIDKLTERTFREYLATRYYTPVQSLRLLLDADLLAITTLKTDKAGDGTFEDTWDAADDYHLKPFNAPSDRRPYWEIAVPATGGDFSFSVGIARSVEIAGRWGFFRDLAANGTLGAAIADTTGTSVTMTAGHGLEALQTILIDSEQLYITAIVTNTLTVERAVNGTTAATHLNAAAVQRYRYPSPVVDACAELAEAMLRPFGVPGSAEDTQQSRLVVVPHIVHKLIQSYRLAWVA